MAKIKVHPTDPTMFMFWDIGLGQPSAFYIRGDRGWQWNGDFEKPTVTPSILIKIGNTVSHLFIRDGKIRYMLDCTHPMAGVTVDMVDFPEDW